MTPSASSLPRRHSAPVFRVVLFFWFFNVIYLSSFVSLLVGREKAKRRETEKEKEQASVVKKGERRKKIEVEFFFLSFFALSLALPSCPSLSLSFFSIIVTLSETFFSFFSFRFFVFFFLQRKRSPAFFEPAQLSLRKVKSKRGTRESVVQKKKRERKHRQRERR